MFQIIRLKEHSYASCNLNMSTNTGKYEEHSRHNY